MGLTPVPDDRLAAVVTHLEMLERPKPRPLPGSPLKLMHWPAPASERYRTLFRRIGEPWLWFSRLVLVEDALRAILDDPAVEIYAATDHAGIELGMLELDFRTPGQCELAYFGFVPELTGKGNGGWLMAHALGLAWRKGIERVWVHSCTLDHPTALGFYQRHGFVPFRREIETFVDPRTIGVVSPDAAPGIPRLG